MAETSCDNLKVVQAGCGSTVRIPDKLYFKIGEVCELTGVKQHVLRYWESEFKILNPQRARSKQRLYRKVDVENVFRIKHLLKNEGFTINGAKKALANKEGVDAGLELPAATAPANNSAAEADMVSEVKAELIALKKMLED